ncbi:hypothetical protein K438DRAFT_446638 [Mycena galopus ATCC 62051]|nr:hypothetical protein K438DRAFT_446638 [Mycena galopus ATCC 62051]
MPLSLAACVSILVKRLVSYLCLCLRGRARCPHVSVSVSLSVSTLHLRWAGQPFSPRPMLVVDYLPQRVAVCVRLLICSPGSFLPCSIPGPSCTFLPPLLHLRAT